jgi:hypothetical protein
MRTGRWVKILRECDEPLCIDCTWGDDAEEVLANSEPPPGVTREELRRRGRITGERFWCEVLLDRPDGSMIARVDNETRGPGVPRLNEVIVLPADEPILDVEWGDDAGR